MDTVKIFWPKHLSKDIKESGYLVGWDLGVNGASFANACQVTADMEAYHQELASEEPLKKPKIVGYLSRENEGLCEPDARDLSTCLHPCRVIVTLYEQNPQKPMHFYKASPLNLDLTATQPHIHSPLQTTLDYINTTTQLYMYMHDSDAAKRRASHQQDDKAISSGFTSDLCNLFLALSAFILRLLDTPMSAVGQQLDLVLRRLAYLTEQARQPRHVHNNAQHVSIWNSIWVIAVDIALGCILGTVLLFYAAPLYTVVSLEKMIFWLDGAPAGLKLNKGLDHFLAELFLWLIHFWTITFQPLMQYVKTVVVCASWAGFVVGFSMQLVILSDTMALTTLHTYWFYMIATRIFHWQLLMLYSLFNLFRGRKHNVLRNRIDSCDYDLDQLLIGTILFTLLIYLFPTVLVYYLTFAMRRVVVIMGQGLLEILLSIVNHFPIFYIIQRIRDPLLFPGGVAYSRLDVTVIEMRSIPVPFTAIFFQYYQIWVQFSANYLSWGLLRSLLVGDVIHPVPRLQHTMIPGVAVGSKSK
ncbi:Gpi1-domain-containing protein [Linderina pennispora]|uniref:Gpi1-domain-containing protein n=1 Tax=Linderina pennispora TaxID=61395 RepID=A0A1Y1W456_9FUNG|nr:Gpi1-domain-containing protein [Linderina pennispora]ORX68350.1 Gpi1-domain-containing protein [Linderina pennispora]